MAILSSKIEALFKVKLWNNSFLNGFHHKDAHGYSWFSTDDTNLLTQKCLPPTWLTDLKACHVHAGLISAHLDKSLTTRGLSLIRLN